jgi:uncharacterized protein YcbX
MNGTGGAGEIAVTGLNVYPIKSCAGTALARAEIGPRGIRHDREFMIVAAGSGEMLTQREVPRLALIRPAVGDGTLRVEAPGMPPVEVAPVVEGDERAVSIWRDTCRAVDQGGHIGGWISEFLGSDVRMVRMAEDEVRRVDPAYATSDRDQVGFADGYPFLLISEESLADLNGRMAEPLPMNRFRPNIVVAGGGAPYLEDGWQRIAIGGIAFRVAKACARCAIPTTDQATAARGKEPLTTLATYRKGERGVLFGQNLIHDETGTIGVGERVEVVA